MVEVRLVSRSPRENHVPKHFPSQKPPRPEDDEQANNSDEDADDNASSADSWVNELDYQLHMVEQARRFNAGRPADDTACQVAVGNVDIMAELHQEDRGRF